MKEEWLFHGAVVPIDVETTAALVAEINRLIDVIGGMALAQPEHEPVAKYSDIVSDGGLDPRNTNPPQREFVGLTDEEIEIIYAECNVWDKFEYERMLETRLKDKNT